MGKANRLISIIEGKVLEHEIDVLYDNIKGWFIDHKNRKYNIHHLLSDEWISSTPKDDGVTGIIKFTAYVSAEEYPTREDPGNPATVEIESAELDLDNGEVIDIIDMLDDWDVLKDSLEYQAMESE